MTAPPELIAKLSTTIPPAVAVTVPAVCRQSVCTFAESSVTSPLIVIAPLVESPISRTPAVIVSSSASDRARTFVASAPPRRIVGVVADSGRIVSVLVPALIELVVPMLIESAMNVCSAPASENVTAEVAPRFNPRLTVGLPLLAAPVSVSSAVPVRFTAAPLSITTP